LIAACSLTALAVSAPTAASAVDTADAQTPAGDSSETIYVYGTRAIRDIPPERDLDPEAIESYGQNSISELLGELQGELGDPDEPLILVNGERVTDLSDIGDLPVEALERVRVLPRGTAVAAGGRARQRVLDIRLKKNFRSLTLLAASRFATDGDWHAERGEATVSYVRGPTRANLSFKARPESDLLESERGIEQPDPILPYAIEGNVIGFPDMDGEIDPLLSAAAGEIVTVTPLPGIANPDLLDFIEGANEAAVTGLGEFRTLRPRTRNYDINGTFTTRLAPWLKGTAGLRFNRSTRRSLRGLPQALFLLSPANASSPFSTTVALAQYGTEPLATRSERTGGEGRLSLNGTFGQWTGLFSAKHSYYKDETETERSVVGSIPIADSTNPFATELSGLVPSRTDHSEARTGRTNAQLSFTGPLFKLPAGPAQATLEAEYDHNKIRSESDFALLSQDRSFSRTETSLRAAIDVPLTVRGGFGGAIGDLSVSGDISRLHFSDAGNATNYALGVAWQPHPVLRLSADLEEIRQPPVVQFLGNPIIVTSGVRTFDPLTGETVDVTQITGGNPDLDTEKTTVKRFGAIIRPLDRLNLQINAEYTDTTERNFVSSLPEASAAVMLAFPDRFVRNLDGVLTTVDLRPVNFDEHREKRFRYGFNLSVNLGGGPGMAAPPPVTDSDEDDSAAHEEQRARPQGGRIAPRTRLSLTASHSIVFEDEITIRDGLPDVDLLDGGAIGLGGGRVRHQLDATASLASGGTGIRVNANWRGKSELNALDSGVADRLSFSPVFNLGVRAFADLHRFLPHSQWAKGTRLSINIQNLTNDRQEVRDSFGDTPLRYQPGYRDPLGRTIEFEIRKLF
jgi:hypothetical protein